MFIVKEMFPHAIEQYHSFLITKHFLHASKIQIGMYVHV